MLHVRKAAPADAPLIVAFNAALAQESEGVSLAVPVLERGVARLLGDPSLGGYFVAERDGRVVGQVMVTFEWSDWRNAPFWWIQSVYVVPEARRQGVYRVLHATVEREARAAGACGLRLYVERSNAVAQATYRRVGLDESHYLMFEGDLRK